MKKTLLFVSIVLTTTIGIAQCPPSLTLTTQQEIDDFAINYPNCDGTGLSLEINNEVTPITNLNGLSQLNTVSSLGIFFTNATDLSGLDNITIISFHLRILGNADLESLNGLQSLKHVGNGLRIIINENLLSLEGLSGLTEIIGDVDISGNTSLQSLSGLNNLTRVSGSLEIKSLPSLTDLLGLESLMEVGLSPADRLYIFNNPQIGTLEGLENLQTINGSLNLRLNGDLASIIELSALETVTEEINFQNNAQLSFCGIDVICNNLENTNIELIFTNNALGCSSIEEVEASCLLSSGQVDLERALILYPNPVSEILQIHTSEGIVLQKTTVYSVLGEELSITSEEKVDFSNFSSGMYFVEVATDSGNSTRKIVKQ